MSCNDYNLHLDSSSGGDEPTPEYYIHLDGVGINGFSPTINFVNQTSSTFQIQTSDVNGVNLSGQIPLMSYIADNYITNTSLATTLSDYSTSAEIASAYLKVDGSNADNPISINGIILRNYSDYSNIIKAKDDLSLELSNGGSILNNTRATISLATNGNATIYGDNNINIHSYQGNVRIYSDSGKAYYGTIANENELATVGDIPTVSDATITLTQGGVTKGTFTLNGSATTIDLDAGGGSITNPLEITDGEVGNGTIYVEAGNTPSQNQILFGKINNGSTFVIPAIMLGAVSNPLSVSDYQLGLKVLSLNYDTDILKLDSNNKLTVKGMVGADGVNAGNAGLVPAPTATDNDKYLCGDGTWKTVSSGTTYTAGTGIDITNDTISIDTSVVAQLSDIPDTSDMATKTWVTNQGYLTSITSGDVTTALGYTPYDSSNPNGYTNNVGTVTSVNNVLPVNGNVTLSIPSTTYMVTTNTQQTITANKVFDDSGILFYDEVNNTNRNGITYNESVGIYVGDTGERLLLQGKDTRPYYNNNSLALFSDIPSLSGYVTTSDLTTTLANYVLSSSLATVATSGSYNDLSNTPTIPTDTSDLTNNAGFITSSALIGYATETWVGNQGYLTSSDISDMATQTWVGQQGYITSISSSDVTTALGYTPYSSSNPNGYTNNVGTVTSVNNTQPDVNGNVTINLTPTVIDGGNA